MAPPYACHSEAQRRLPDGVSLGWAVACLAFITAVFTAGHGHDLGYWTSWMRQLQAGGYMELQANYPPLLLHWLWVGAQCLDEVATGRVSIELIKGWTVFPIWLSWMVLIYQVADSLEKSGTRPTSSWIFWLTVLNPAIIVAGPQWGQVDLLPWIPLSCGLLAHQRGRHMFGPAFFVLAVAAKFQAIVYAPIFAGLYLRALVADRRLLWAIPLCILALLLCFSPFAVAGRAWEQAANAYWGNIGLYPAASTNAANLWKLIGVGETLGDAPLFGVTGVSWVTPRLVGLLLFGLSACLIFARALCNEANVWGLAVAANFCFFAFSPEMHERYLFGAVPAAALWAVHDRTKAGWYAAATALTAFNVWLVFFPRNHHEWFIAAAAVVGAAVILLLEIGGVKVRRNFLSYADRYPRLSIGCLGIVPLIVLTTEIRAWKTIDLSALKVGEGAALVDIPLLKIEQQWDVPRYQWPSQQHKLAFGDVAVSSGIKVHARSELLFRLPPGRFALYGRCGPERAAHSSSAMRFKILLDTKLAWESDATDGLSRWMPFGVFLQGPADVRLTVDPLGSNYGDHGLWADVELHRLE